METGSLNFETNVAMWGTIVGFLMPLAIAALNGPTWAPWMRGAMTFVASFVAALGTAYFSGELDKTDDVVTAMMTVFGAAITTYHFWWKPSNIAPRVEYKTSRRDFNLYNVDKLNQPPPPATPSNHAEVYKPQ